MNAVIWLNEINLFGLYNIVKTGFPRDKDLVATIRPLDDYSNTYIGIHVVDRMFGSEKYKYADSRLWLLITTRSKLYYSL